MPEPIYDLAAARAARDAGIALVDLHANAEWKAAALDAVLYVAKRREFFTTDAVWFILERDGLRVHDNRAMGPVMQRARRRGFCVPTNETRPSVREVHHACPVRVWRSNVY